MIEKLQALKVMTEEQYEALDDKSKSQLLKVLGAITVLEGKRKEHLSAYKENAINPSSVSRYVNFVRRTLYNNDFLMNVINAYEREQEKIDIFNRIKVLEDKIKELTEIIEQMQFRDIQIENLVLQVANLERDIAYKVKAYNDLEEENYKLLKTINELEGITTKSNILAYKKRN